MLVSTSISVKLLLRQLDLILLLNITFLKPSGEESRTSKRKYRVLHCRPGSLGVHMMSLEIRRV